MVPTPVTRIANRPGEAGAVLVIVTLAMLVLLSLGLALSLGASLESVIAGGHVATLEARHAAEAGLSRAAADLGVIPDWNLALAGALQSGFFQCGGGGTHQLSFGGSVDVDAIASQANCGRSAGCTAADLVEVTEERPWGIDNPVWRLFACGRLDALIPAGGSAPPFYLVVLLADNGGDGDGNPWADADGGRGAGAGLVWLRAVAAGPAGSRATLQAAIERDPGAAGSGRIRLVAWHHLR